MYRFVTSAAALAATIAASPTKAGEIVTLEPSGKWVLEYAHERCSLMRSFGDQLTLQIDSYGSLDEFRVMVSGKAVPRSRDAAGLLAYRLTPDAEQREEEPAVAGTVGGAAALSFSTDFGPSFDVKQVEQLKPKEKAAFFKRREPTVEPYRQRVENIAIEFENGESVDLKLDSIKSAFQAMDGCIDNLLRHWGLDPAQQRSLTMPPVPRPSTVRRVQGHYPSDMLMSGTNAFVPVRIMIAADGSVTECVVQIPSVEDAFQDAVCDGLASGFEPATDSDGKPVASVFQTAVIYLLNGRR